MNLRKIETDIQNLLKPIHIYGFGKVKSVQGARRKLKRLITPFITNQLKEICKYQEFIFVVNIQLKDFNKKGYDKIGGETLIDKNNMIHFFTLDIDKHWLEQAYLGNKNIRTRLIRSLTYVLMHEILHMYQFERSKIPVNYENVDKDNIIKKGTCARLRYYSDKTEISAFALNTAQELFYSLNDVNKIKHMLCQMSNYKTLAKRSSSFWRYYHYVRSNFEMHPKIELIWKLYLKRLIWYLDELYLHKP